MRILVAMLLLAGLLQMVFLLFYYYSAVRFLSDFYLPLALGGFLIVWQADRYLYGKGWLRGLFWLGVSFLTLQSVVIAFFSGLNLFPYYFSHHNPALWQHVIDLTNHYQHVIYALLKPGSIFSH